MIPQIFTITFLHYIAYNLMIGKTLTNGQRIASDGQNFEKLVLGLIS